MIHHSTFLALVCAGVSSIARAEFIGTHVAHPIAWMYQLPVGETPGWTNRAWFNLEANQANVWNKEADFTNLDSNRVQTLAADFEQTSIVADVGLALSPRWAASVEVPYANRNGGFMDAGIDQFHILVDSNRFLRNRFGKFGNHFILEDDGTETLSTPRAEGVGSIKLKLKHWLWAWRGEVAGACECGFAVSTQLKIPLRAAKDGLSSGTANASALVHLGAPLGRESGVWFTAGYTRLDANRLTRSWPMIRDQRMFELSADVGVYANFGLVVQLRTETPLMDGGRLRFEPLSNDPEAIKYERLTTAWNALVDWRTTEVFGVRWRWGQGQQVSLLATEDFGTGNRDGLGTALYSNNAPDFAFVTQFHLVF